MSPSRSPSASRSRSPIKRRQKSPSPSDSICPFLIRIFVSKGKHTPMLEFEEGRFPIRDEFSAYGWKHSTPTSLIALLLPSFPAPYRSPAARYSFRHIYVDASQRGLYRHRDLVSFTGRDFMATITNEAKSQNISMDTELGDTPEVRKGGKKVEEKTLDQYGYVTGDIISVCVHIPEPRLPPPVRAGGPVPAVTGAGKPSFGWNERSNGAGSGDRGDKTWGRGEPLPPQNTGRPRGSIGRDEPAGGGAWRGGGSGMGIRGSFGRRGSRSPPPHVGRDSRDGGFERNGNGARRRSRSPETRDRRESWGRR